MVVMEVKFKVIIADDIILRIAVMVDLFIIAMVMIRWREWNGWLKGKPHLLSKMNCNVKKDQVSTFFMIISINDHTRGLQWSPTQWCEEGGEIVFQLLGVTNREMVNSMLDIYYEQSMHILSASDKQREYTMYLLKIDSNHWRERSSCRKKMSHQPRAFSAEEKNNKR